LEKDGKILVLDCGLKFSDVPGVDFLFFLSHGHEDHIGGVPFFLQKVKVPVFGSRLSLELVKANLGSRAAFVEVKAGESQKLGPFKLDFVEMRHSIPEALGLYVETETFSSLEITKLRSLLFRVSPRTSRL